MYKMVHPLLLLLLPSVVQGAAFQHFQQSTPSIGCAHADMAIVIDEPSAVFYNPAGMAFLQRSGVQLGFASSYIHTDLSCSNKIVDASESAIYEAVLPILGSPPGLTASYESLALASKENSAAPVVGFVHGAYCINLGRESAVAFGASATSPWGLQTDWRGSKMGSYAAFSSFHSVAVTGAVALRYRIFSGGAGIVWQDFRFDCDNVLLGSSFDFKLKDSKYGGYAGLMCQVLPCLRVGIVYRSQINYNLKGKVYAGNNSGRGDAKMTTPQTFMGGLAYQVNACWSLMATGVYTCWSQFKEIDIATSIPTAVQSTAIPFSFSNSLYTFDFGRFRFPTRLRDTFFVALGCTYCTGPWELRAGFGYDSDPCKKFREALIPDNEHFIGGLGLGYQCNRHLRLDLGYQYLYLPKAEIRSPLLSVNTDYIRYMGHTTSSVDQINERSVYQGSIQSFAQVVSAQVRWDF